jgi:hypothetical protein
MASAITNVRENQGISGMRIPVRIQRESTRAKCELREGELRAVTRGSDVPYFCPLSFSLDCLPACDNN